MTERLPAGAGGLCDGEAAPAVGLGAGGRTGVKIEPLPTGRAGGPGLVEVRGEDAAAAGTDQLNGEKFLHIGMLDEDPRGKEIDRRTAIRAIELLDSEPI